MIEDYGTLSEDELLTEIEQELEDRTEIDVDLLEFNFEDGKLIVQGTLTNEEELESLVGILETHIEPEDYDLEVELLEGESELLKNKNYSSEDEGTKEAEDILDDLDDMDEDEVDFVDEEDLDDEKW